MNEKLKELTPENLLERWGLRVTGDSLDAPVKPLESASHVGADIDLAVVSYVSTTKDYPIAAPILLHKYGRGEFPSTFRMVQPGETILHACLRLGWCDLLRVATPTELPLHVLNLFVDNLVVRCREQPFLVPKNGEPDDVTIEPIYCEVPAHMKAFFPRGYGLPQTLRVRSKTA